MGPMANSKSVPGWGLALVRLTLGVLVTRTGWSWVTGEGLAGRTFKGWIDGGLDEAGSIGGWWGREVLLYNPDGVAFLLAWTVLLAGIALVLGAFTRPAATWVAFVGVHALYFDITDGSATLLLVVVALACAMSRAGRRLGLDSALDGNLPTWMTWVQGRNDFLG